MSVFGIKYFKINNYNRVSKKFTFYYNLITENQKPELINVNVKYYHNIRDVIKGGPLTQPAKSYLVSNCVF